MKRSQNSYKELVAPLISYFASIIKEEPYEIIYEKWEACDKMLSKIEEVLADITGEVLENSPTKFLMDYHKFFYLKRLILYNDLDFCVMRDSLIDIIKYRDLCIKHTMVLSIFFYRTTIF